MCIAALCPCIFGRKGTLHCNVLLMYDRVDKLVEHEAFEDVTGESPDFHHWVRQSPFGMNKKIPSARKCYSQGVFHHSEPAARVNMCFLFGERASNHLA
jgi:hypothetical protein